MEKKIVKVKARRKLSLLRRRTMVNRFGLSGEQIDNLKEGESIEIEWSKKVKTMCNHLFIKVVQDEPVVIPDPAPENVIAPNIIEENVMVEPIEETVIIPEIEETVTVEPIVLNPAKLKKQLPKEKPHLEDPVVKTTSSSTSSKRTKKSRG